MADDQLPTIVEFSEDLSTVEAPVPLPVGEYIGTVRAAEVKLSQKEKKYGAITYFISPDQYPADYTDGNPEGTTLVFRKLGLEDTPQARWFARKFCETHGVVPSRSIDVSSFVGTEARLHIKHERYEGIDRAVVDKVASAS
jgi:hypothetical protein